MSTGFPTVLESRAALPTGVPVPQPSEAAIRELYPFLMWVQDTILALEAKVGIDSSAVAASLDYKTANARRTFVLLSDAFDLDNGAGTTVDVVMWISGSQAITLVSAFIVYEDATTGTVAAGNVKLGTTVGGTEIAASTAYENAKAVGTSTTITLSATTVNIGTAIFARHTGVAATQAGKARIRLECRIN